MKKKIALRSVIPAQAGISLLALTLLVACGDTVENVYQTGLEAYASEDDLPKCNKEHENELAFVKDAGVALVCVDGDWVATSPESTGNVDFSCKTEELKDKSGLKIVCNGDSIGVVLNGSDGKDGEKGDKGDDGVDGKDGEDAGMTQSDTTVNDSEKVAISLDSLAGYTQKGPFLKGSTVYLYELSDGRTLKQTNGNFTSKITRDDGHYKFTARDLVSQYAMLVVDGFYRNEVTGEKSDASLRLTALTDMRKRSSANVNLLTHLEFDRVYQLVTRGDSTGKKLTVKQAKRQAQKEILKQFHIELDSTTDAEDMDVFGSSDADAALLAVSILLQGDSGTTDLSVLLTEISNDIAEFGEWKNDSAKAAIADWAMVADTANKLTTFSSNVTNWGLGAAPDFAKFVRNFWYGEYGIDACTGKREGEVIATKNKKSDYYNTKMRFICRSGAWRSASNIEKDTVTWGAAENREVRAGQVNTNIYYIYETNKNAWRNATLLEYDTYKQDCLEDGTIVPGKVVSTNEYVCDNGEFRTITGTEISWRRGCVSYIRGESYVLGDQLSHYKCTSDGWIFDIERSSGTVKDNAGKMYKTITIGNQTWMAENLNFDYKVNRATYGTYTNTWCDTCGRYYTWAAAMDSAGVYSDNSKGCGDGKTCTVKTPARGICPEGWHIPTSAEWNTLYSAIDSFPYAMRAKGDDSWYDTDAYGFSALPAGYYYNDSFSNRGSYAYFWSATEIYSNGAYFFYLDASDVYLNHGSYKNYGYSVRCVKD